MKLHVECECNLQQIAKCIVWKMKLHIVQWQIAFTLHYVYSFSIDYSLLSTVDSIQALCVTSFSTDYSLLSSVDCIYTLHTRATSFSHILQFAIYCRQHSHFTYMCNFILPQITVCYLLQTAFTLHNLCNYIFHTIID